MNHFNLVELCTSVLIERGFEVETVDRLLRSAALGHLEIFDVQSLSMETVIRLADGLKRSGCVKLTMRNCNIDNEKLRALFEGLRNSPTICFVSFERNRGITDPSCLEDILPTMTSLKYLSMNHCSITAKGAHALLRALQRTPSLTKLKIQIQRTRGGKGRPLLHPNILRRIYFYCRWNELEGWKLWKAPHSVWSHALARLDKMRYTDVMFHLLRKHPEVCLQTVKEEEEEHPAKRLKEGSMETTTR